MHIAFLKYLCDPQTNEELALHTEKKDDDFILEGELCSPSNTYPVVRGIPRFAGFDQQKNSSESFGYQWSKWGKVQFESENKGRPMEGHTLNMWQQITSTYDQDLHGAVIGDFGCGAGRFIEIVRMKRGRVIGIDLNDQAVEVARENFRDDPDVLICQADVLNPPLKYDCLEGAFSIGVMHHTPDPRKGFNEMVKRVKSGGWIALSVYGKKGRYYDFPVVTLYRKMFKLLRPVFGHYPPLIYTYFSAYLLRPLVFIPLFGKLIRGVFPSVKLPDIKWSILDTFDSVTPIYQSTHETEEVLQWFREMPLVDIKKSVRGPTAHHARKK